MWHRLLIHTFFLFVIVGLLNFAANAFYLYWTTWWVDNILHFLCGAVVAMSIILFLRLFFGVDSINKKRTFFIAIALTIFTGIFWEIFELYFRITYLSDGTVYISDTVSDLILDTIGGLLGTFYSFRILKI